MWAVLLATAAICAAIGHWTKDGLAWRVGASVCVAIVLVQVKKHAFPISDSLQYTLTIAIWLIVLLPFLVAKERQSRYKIHVIKVLLVSVVLCYAAARLGNYPLVFGNAAWPLILSEIAILVSLGLAASNGIVSGIGKFHVGFGNMGSGVFRFAGGYHKRRDCDPDSAYRGPAAKIQE